jgi:hypothetical protein
MNINAYFQSYMYQPFGLPYLVSLNLFVGILLLLGIFDGLANRILSKTLWSTPKKSMLADAFVRGPVLLVVSFVIAGLSVPVTSLAGPTPLWSASTALAMITLWFAVASPFNALAGLGISRFQFGAAREVVPHSTPVLTICPNCRAAYSYSPDRVIDGQASCQNCGRPLSVRTEGPSVG